MTQVRAARLGGRAEDEPARKPCFGKTALGGVDSTKPRGVTVDRLGDKGTARSHSANQAAVLIERAILT